jgi:hypothetical protein
MDGKFMYKSEIIYSPKLKEVIIGVSNRQGHEPIVPCIEKVEVELVIRIPIFVYDEGEFRFLYVYLGNIVVVFSLFFMYSDIKK